MVGCAIDLGHYICGSHEFPRRMSCAGLKTGAILQCGLLEGHAS
jgi:hypothetical protein